MKSIFAEAGSAYEHTLKKLSNEFWAGMGDSHAANSECDIEIKSSSTDEEPVRSKDPNEVHGIVLPQNVINQLRLLGIPVEWYTAGELQDAVIACSSDATLVDDHEGTSLRDKLRLDESEKEERRLRREARAQVKHEEEKHHHDEMEKEHLLMEEHDEDMIAELHLDVRTRNERIRERQEERARQGSRRLREAMAAMKLTAKPLETVVCDSFRHDLCGAPYLRMQNCHEAHMASAA